MEARLGPPVYLEHPVIFEKDRAVRLFGAEPAHHDALRRWVEGEQLGVAKADLVGGILAGAQGEGRLVSDRLGEGQRETVLRQRVDQRALAAELAQLRQGHRRQRLAQIAAGRRPHRGERQEIRRRRRLALVLCRRTGRLRLDDLQEETAVPGIARVGGGTGDLAACDHSRRLDALVLGGEPALARQKAGDHLAFDERQIVPAEQIGPALRHHQRDEFGGKRRQSAVDVGLGRGQLEPEEAIALQRQHIRLLADLREDAAAQHLDDLAAAELGKIEFQRLGRARQIGDAEDYLAFPQPQIGDHLAVGRVKKPQGAAPHRPVRPARRDEALGPVQQRGGRAALGLDIDRLEPVNRVHDRRQIELRRVGPGKPAIPVE